MATIWRLECPETRVGVYRCRGGAAEAILLRIETEHSGMVHPVPHADPRLAIAWNDILCEGTEAYRAWFFGFGSLAQYRQWVFKPSARRALRKHVVLAQYEVADEDMHLGTFQAIFRRDRASHIADHPTTYEEETCAA